MTASSPHPAPTERLSFRVFSSIDEEAMAAVLCDADVMEFSDNGPLPPKAVAGWLAEQTTAATHGGLPFGRWAVVETATGTVIGYATVSRHEGRSKEGEAEIGYRLTKTFWGKGYGTEVAKGLITHGLSLPGVTRLIAIVSTYNKASVRVLEKAGLTISGEIMLPGYDYPDLVYSVARVD